MIIKLLETNQPELCLEI